MESRIQARKSDFKKTFDDTRRRREDAQVQIRKSNRDSQLAKRRQEVSENVLVVTPSGKPIGVQDLPMLTASVNSSDYDAQYEATQHFRRLLSIAQSPPIQAVVDCGVVPRFVSFLAQSDKPALQFEAAWALTNIASGSPDQTSIVVEAGAVPLLVNLLSSAKRDVVEQAIWTLGNIAGDSPQCRDKVLEAGCMDALLKILQVTSDCSGSIGILRYGTWALSNLSRGKPEPKFELVLPALPVIRNLLYLQDVEVLQDACWAISYISDGSDPRCIQDVILSGVCPRLVSLLDHGALSVVTPALRAIGNIVAGSDEQTQAVLQTGCLNPLKNLLSHSKKTVRKEACWTISNITAGNRGQIQAVINADIIPPLLSMLQNGDTEVKREAAWAVSNAASGGDIAQVEYLLNCGCFQPLSDLLDVDDSKVVVIALEAIENILKTGKDKQETEGLDTNPYVPLLEMSGAFPKLEHLQGTHQGSRVFQITWRIMTTYLDPELDADEAGPGMENMQQTREQAFGNFGVQNQAAYNF